MMSDKIDDAKIAQVARDWIAYQSTNLLRYAWALDEKDIWFYEENDWATMVRFVRAVCAIADVDDSHVIDMIGASLLEDLIDAHPENAIAFLDGAVGDNPVLAKALDNVWCNQPELHSKIEAIRDKSG
jgi:hypothetical protein